MSDDVKKGDELDAVIELKAMEARIVEKYDEVKDAVETAAGQIKENGDSTQEAKAAIEAVTKQYDELYDRMQEVEQNGVKGSDADEAFNIGKAFLEDEQFVAFKEGRSGRARMEVKTAIVNATGQNQPLVPSDRLAGIATTPNRNLTIRDVLPSSATDSNLVEFTRESAFTNNAGPQIANSPEEYENVTKPESAMTFTLVNEPVSTLAHFIPASVQVLDDAPSLMSHINGRLMYGLKLKEETQLLSGSGSNHELNGLITQATAFVHSSSPERTNEIDIIRDAIRQAHVGEYSPNFLVLNPVDWFDIEIRKVGTSDDRYVVGNPRSLSAPSLWSLPTVVTNSITAGTFLIGSSQGAEIKDRQMAAVEMSREDSTNFQKNMITIRAEERLALCVYRTEAFITGSL